MSELSVGEVAKACGVSADTIRHYERVGVLPPPERSDNGYRRYPETTIQRVLTIRRALQIGFSLSELVRIFKKRAAGQAPCADVRALAVTKLAELDQRIDELHVLRDAMAATIEQWNARLDAAGPGELAHLLESLDSTTKSG